MFTKVASLLILGAKIIYIFYLCKKITEIIVSYI